MLNGIMLLWFLLTAMAVVFVAIDIRSTPESPVLKWGFILLVAYTGPIGAFMYVLGCREPLPGLHERYVATRWRQVLGSTMHCVAGDGVGILVGAAVASYLTLSRPVGIVLEYTLGFGFGWTIFQALFMREMAGSYRRSLAKTFLPEFLSMNLLMTGMVPIASLGMILVGGMLSPLSPEFWFVMSMALLAGFVVAFPMNWWLVAKGLKHGMITVRRPEIAHSTHVPEHGASQAALASPNQGHAGQAKASRNEIVWMILLSIVLFALALGAAELLRGRYGQTASLAERTVRCATTGVAGANSTNAHIRGGI
ncbi:MAG: DUF4396 domain-containing protein [Acidobacteriota bacterium]|nr:DUF4396 domain-containing protein [Acidobacteriota bacterium]